MSLPSFLYGVLPRRLGQLISVTYDAERLTAAQY